jgi:hypothetical protein
VERYPITPKVDYPEIFDSGNEPEQFMARRRSSLRGSISNQSDAGFSSAGAAAPWQQKYIKHSIEIFKTD